MVVSSPDFTRVDPGEDVRDKAWMFSASLLGVNRHTTPNLWYWIANQAGPTQLIPSGNILLAESQTASPEFENPASNSV